MVMIETSDVDALVREKRSIEIMDNKRRWSPPQIIWSALITIVVWTAVGFSWFGHGFDWSTPGSAKRMTAKAVTENLATICAAQARSAPDAEAAVGQRCRVATLRSRVLLSCVQPNYVRFRSLRG
jgi:hypothetical protein